MSEMTDEQRNSALFVQLIWSLNSAAMMAMGKITNPATNKLEHDLEQARFNIDLLGMLKEKTKSNLDENESRVLETMLTNLRLTFVQESKKPRQEEPEAPASAGKESARESEPDEKDESPHAETSDSATVSEEQTRDEKETPAAE